MEECPIGKGIFYISCPCASTGDAKTAPWRFVLQGQHPELKGLAGFTSCYWLTAIPKAQISAQNLLRSGCWTLGSDVLLDETTREPQLKGNLMEIWTNAQFLCQHGLESTDPGLNHEVGCELTSWAEYPWDDRSVQWLVPCCETGDPVSGTPFILRCTKWQKKGKN